MSSWSEKGIAILNGIINVGITVTMAALAVVSTSDGADAFKRPYVQISLVLAFLGALRSQLSPTVQQGAVMDAKIATRAEEKTEAKIQTLLDNGTIEMKD